MPVKVASKKSAKETSHKGIARPSQSQTARHAGASATESRMALADPLSASPAAILSLQQTHGNQFVQRLLDNAVQRQAPVGLEGGEVDSGLQGQIERARGGGQTLDSRVGSQIGQVLGSDLSGVRIHTDSSADTLNRSLNAKAFTHGSDIFFSRGAYNPRSSSGKELLAHELTHVVQQGGGKASRTQTKLTVGPAGDPYEREADRVAKQVVKGSSRATTAVGAHGLPANQVARSAAVESRAPTGTIQRAVGYEFETNFKVERERGGFTGLFSPYRKMKKMELIKSYTEGFRMEADENSRLGSTIEFVVDPPVQEDDRDKLVTILDKLQTVSGQIDAGKAGGEKPVMLNKLTGDAVHKGVRVTPHKDGLTSNPQVTGGVSFDKLMTLFSEVSKPGKKGEDNPYFEAKNELIESGKDFVDKAVTRVAGVAGSEPLKALVAMLVAYLRFGAASMGSMLNYAKLISNAILFRTDFGSMFKKLDPVERKPFEDDPQSFTDLVLGAAGQAGTGATAVFERGVRKSTNPKSKDYNKRFDIPVTRQAWLTDITTGVDQLSSHHVPAMKSEFEGLGALGLRTDRVGADPAPADPKQKDKGSGIIMEFRNMKKNVPYTKWRGLAISIFDYLSALNNRKKEAEKDKDEDKVLA